MWQKKENKNTGNLFVYYTGNEYVYKHEIARSADAIAFLKI